MGTWPGLVRAVRTYLQLWAAAQVAGLLAWAWALDPKGPWTLLDGQTLPGTPAASPALPLIWCLQSQLCTPTSVHPPKSLRKVVFQLPPAVYFALKPTYKFNQTLLH